MELRMVFFLELFVFCISAVGNHTSIETFGALLNDSCIWNGLWKTGSFLVAVNVNIFGAKTWRDCIMHSGPVGCRMDQAFVTPKMFRCSNPKCGHLFGNSWQFAIVCLVTARDLPIPYVVLHLCQFCSHDSRFLPTLALCFLTILRPIPSTILIVQLVWKKNFKLLTQQPETDYLISPNTLPSFNVTNTIELFGPPTTSTIPLFTIYISLPTSP